MGLNSFLNKEQQQRVVAAIGAAERCTSGEIRVHVEPKCKAQSVLDRAVEVFNQLKMYATLHRNGVLIYIAYRSHDFAIIGDKGINERVPDSFWDEEKGLLARFLKDGNPCAGLEETIRMIGDRLAEYFPATTDDKNEQSDEISYGK